jgi:hypothetical protein
VITGLGRRRRESGGNGEQERRTGSGGSESRESADADGDGEDAEKERGEVSMREKENEKKTERKRLRFGRTEGESDKERTTKERFSNDGQIEMGCDRGVSEDSDTIILSSRRFGTVPSFRWFAGVPKLRGKGRSPRRGNGNWILPIHCWAERE